MKDQLINKLTDTCNFLRVHVKIVIPVGVLLLLSTSLLLWFLVKPSATPTTSNNQLSEEDSVKSGSIRNKSDLEEAANKLDSLQKQEDQNDADVAQIK